MIVFHRPSFRVLRILLPLALYGGAACAAVPLGPVGGRGEPVEGTSFLRILSLDASAPGYQGGLRVDDMVYGAFGEEFGTTLGSYYGYAGAVQDFGLAIERAEAGDGALPLSVLRPAVGAADLVLSLPAAGAFGPAYPLGSPKFDALYNETCDRIHGRLSGSGDQGYNGGWFGLILLSHPDWNSTSGARPYRNSINSLRAWCTGYLNGIVLAPVEEGEPGYVSPGLENWTVTSATMFLAEYIRKTGETAHLPTLQRAADALANRIQDWQQPDGPLKPGLMGHGGVVGDYPHIGFSGINIINAHAMAALALCNGAGVTVDDYKFLTSWDWVKGTMASGGQDDGNIGYAWRQGGGDSAGRTSGVLFGMENYGATGAAYASYLDRMKSYLVRAYPRMQHAHAYTLGGVALYQFALPYLEDRDQRYIMENWRFYYNLARQPDGTVAYVGGRENNGGDGYLNLDHVGWVNTAIAAATGSGHLPGFPAPNPDRIHADLTSPWSQWPTPEARTMSLSNATTTLEVDITDAQGTVLAPAAYACTWTHVSGPATAAFDDPASATTGITFPASGAYRIQLSVTRGGYTLVETYDVDAAYGPSIPGYATGAVDYDVWLNLPGNDVSILTGSPDYPDRPDASGTLAAIDHVYGADDFGERIHGHIVPPTTGNYRFYLSSDDEAEWWLNPAGADPAGRALIASTPDWTDPYEWTKFPSQTSALFPLTAGTPYAFEALLKQGGGLHHIAVAWTGPGISTPEVIGGSHIAVALPTNLAPAIVLQPSDATASLGGSVTMDLAAEGVGPFLYQWQLNGVPYWPAGTTPSLTLDNLGAGLAGFYQCVVVNPHGVATSEEAELTINGVGDLVPGGLWRDVYTDIEGNSVADLTGSFKFPRLADASGVMTTAEAPSNYADSYGQRWTGWLKPQVTGSYRFYLTSDDHSELWLSTDATVGNASVIASVYGWTGERDWPGAAKSSYRTLDAGQRYYIEVRHKDGGGDDHLALNWQRSGETAPAGGDPAMPGSLFEYLTGGTFDDPLPPEVTLVHPVGPNVYLPADVGLILEASVTDDGQPDPPGITTTLWNQVSGPDLATFGDTSLLNTTAVFPSPGTYVLRLSAWDGEQTGSADLAVHFDDPLGPIQAAWTGTRVGSLSGSATHGQAGGVFTLTADGPNSVYRTRTTDDAYVLHTSVAGDCSVVARVLNHTGSSLPARARAGVIIRQDTTAGSPSAFVGLDARGNGCFVHRPTAGAANTGAAPFNGLGFSTWVKLERQGDSFHAYHSPDGVSWTAFNLSPVIPMSGTVLVGLAAASGDATLATATLDEVSVAAAHTGNTAPAVSAGPGQVTSPSVPATLTGSAFDDGLPSPPGAVSVQWSKISGPGSVTFGTPTLPSTSVSLEAIGDYVLRLAANDGEATTFSEMTFQVEALPLINLVVDDDSASEYTGDVGHVTVLRAGGTGQSVQVELAYAGDASNGGDVQLLPGTIALGPGQTSSGLVVHALSDTLSEGPESLEMHLAADPHYAVGMNGTGVVTVADTPIDDWRFTWFGTNANTPVAMDLADGDADGYYNLWEYGSGGIPTLHDDRLDPRLSLAPSGVVFTYQAATDAPGVYWSIFGAEALDGTWNEAFPSGIATNVLGPSTMEIHCTFPTGIETQRFLKLQINRP